MDKHVGGIQKKYKREFFSQHQEFFESLVEGQSSRALLITFSDSRIDPNVLTQTELGEIFIQRTAGNIVPPYGSVRGGATSSASSARARSICPYSVQRVADNRSSSRENDQQERFFDDRSGSVYAVQTADSTIGESPITCAALAQTRGITVANLGYASCG
jgi:hypothetical protein